MAYLEFNKQELVNLEYSLKREILLSNRAGGYVNTTIVGCNTRKYHGLLVVPIDNFNGEKHILLSNVHESLIQHQKSFNLGINSYGEIHEPKGHKYIVDFEMNYASTITYRVGGMVFSKTIMFLRDCEQVLIKYSLLEAHSPTILRIKPFLAFRNIHALTSANTNANTKYVKTDNGVIFNMYKGFPNLFLQLSKENEWIASPDWYKNIVYKEEARRGFESTEDLFVPGYFELPISKGESIILSASTIEENPQNFSARFDKEVIKRIDTRKDYDSCLKLAAKQFIIKRNGQYSICSGYSWDYENLRDSFISLAGLTIFNDLDSERYQKVMDSTIERERYNLTHASNTPDTPLWLIRSLQQYLSFGADNKKIWEKYGSLIKEIIDSYFNGSRYEIFLHENGLLWAEKPGVALTWMNTYTNNTPVTPREGYQVEVNALWYNALCLVLDLAKKLEDSKWLQKIENTINKIKDNYLPIFWDQERKQLYDFISSNGPNNFTRPNQLIAISLDYSPIDEITKMEILKKVEKELLTTRGIRTLSPKNPLYKGVYEGDQANRDIAHHNGCCFPWLLGVYVDSALKLRGARFISKAQALLNAFEEDINIHCIGSVAEIYDGDPAHSPHGCISSAVSVGEILRAKYILSKFNTKG